MALEAVDTELNHLGAVSLNPKDHVRTEGQKELSDVFYAEAAVPAKRAASLMYTMLRGRLEAQATLLNRCVHLLNSESSPKR